MKYKDIAIVVTFFSLWISAYLTNPAQEIAALFLVFSFGILHGSNDLSLISKATASSKPTRIIILIIFYLLIILIASLFFYFIPILALILFIIFSSYHFGEQHFNDLLKSNGIAKRFLFFTYGLALLSLLFSLNSEATLEIILSLTRVELDNTWFYWLLLLSSSAWLLQMLFLTSKKYLTWQELLMELFLLLVFAIVFQTATLIWAFAIYFIFWHSIPSIMEQQSFLYHEVTLRTFFIYVKSSFLIWLVSISAIVVVFFWLEDEAILLPLLFAFLGSITFAHSFTISRMFKLKK